MKLVSLDLETTGVDTLQDQIIEIGLVCFDTSTEFKPTYHRIYYWQDRYEGSAFALQMNAEKLFVADMLHKRRKEWSKNFEKCKNSIVKLTYYKNHKDAEKLFDNHFVETPKELSELLGRLLMDYRIEPKKSTVNIVGKNAAGFDMQFIKRFIEGYQFSWKRRVLDVGNLYTRRDDDCIPDLSVVLERSGILNELPEKYVTHDATDDAFDVAVATYIYYNPEQVVHVQKWYSEYEDWCNSTAREIAMIQEYEFKIPE